jgi:hypothetical protein
MDKRETLKVLALDLGLTNTGTALLSFDGEGFSVDGVGIIRTIPDKGLGRALDDIRRCRLWLAELKPLEESADAIVVEYPTGSQNAQGFKAYGMCMAVMASFSKPLFPIRPDQSKRFLKPNQKQNTKAASKQEVIDWVSMKHPGVLDKRITVAEHQADAILAAYAAQPLLETHYENHCR